MKITNSKYLNKSLPIFLTFGLGIFITQCSEELPEDPAGQITPEEDPDAVKTDENGDIIDTRSGSQRVKDAEAYFTSTVFPLIDKGNCRTCHKDPRFNGPEGAHESIFDFDWCDEKLTKDEGPLGNELIRKIQGLDDHGGKNQCSGSIEESPCAEVVEWWMLKHGRINIEDQISEGASSHIITSFLADGSFYGVAVDGADSTVNLQVRFYIDGESGTGDLLPEVEAASTGHKFKFTALTDKYKDGVTHKAYVYSIGIDGNEIEFSNSPYSFKSHTPKGLDDYYLVNVPTKMISCAGGSCHAADRGPEGDKNYFREYVQDYSSLSEPAPSEGGTATNNNLYRKLSGATGHRGGNVLGGGNPGLEAALQAWWSKEFE